jgi:hypothetical protein
MMMDTATRLRLGPGSAWQALAHFEAGRPWWTWTLASPSGTNSNLAATQFPINCFTIIVKEFKANMILALKSLTFVSL